MKQRPQKNCPYVCLYESYMETLSPFSDAERGRLVTAMLSYMYEGKEPTFKGSERYIWPTLKSQIDRDKAAYEERCEANRENGKKGGRPKTQKTEGLISKPKKPKEKEKEKEKENENEKDKEKENENENPSGDEAVPASELFEIPDLCSVIKYRMEKQLDVDPLYFYNYYDEKHWMRGDEKIRDWRATMRKWDETIKLKGRLYPQGREL